MAKKKDPNETKPMGKKLPKAAAEGLSRERQRQFVIEYCKDFNATKAALRAGYSEKTAYSIGHENLSKPEIKAAIEKYLAGHRITTDRLLAEVEKVAFSDMDDYWETCKNTKLPQFKGLDRIEPGASRAIKDIKQKRTFKAGGENDEDIIEHTLEFKLHDKVRALELLGRALKLWDNGIQQTTTALNPILPALSQDVAKDWPDADNPDA